MLPRGRSTGLAFLPGGPPELDHALHEYLSSLSRSIYPGGSVAPASIAEIVKPNSATSLDTMLRHLFRGGIRAWGFQHDHPA